MIGEQWPVRVFDADRPAGGGSGFLVAPDLVLTCAHVVHGASSPAVRFPARPDLPEVAATVLHLGAWRPGGDDKGDVAVLRLAGPVPVAPARFAARNALDVPRQLAVLGFPATRDGGGRIALVEPTTTRLLIDGEWVQLQRTAAPGASIARGYSGAAVTVRQTGEVVGMVTAAEERDQLGRMLPTAALLRHWDGLAPLLPLGPLPGPAHAALRAFLQAVPVEEARAAARHAADDLGPEPDPAVLDAAASAYAVADYLAEGLYPDGADEREVAATLSRFCGRLGKTLPGQVAAAPQERVEVGTTVSVEVARSGSGPRAMRLRIGLHAGSRPVAEVFNDVVPSGRLRTVVQQELPRAIAERVPDGQPDRVEFVLPRPWLAKPVDSWTLGPDSVVRIGWRHPVTVRDLARASAAGPDWELDRRWSCLRAGGPSDDVVHWIGCSEPVDASRLAATLAHQRRRAVLAMASPPEPPASHPALRAAFDSGIPAMLWRRGTCGPACGADCAGARFQANLTDQLAKLAGPGGLTELPDLLCRLRAQAGEVGDESHCGHAVTLLWDPPRQHPQAPPLRMAPEMRRGR